MAQLYFPDGQLLTPSVRRQLRQPWLELHLRAGYCSARFKRTQFRGELESVFLGIPVVHQPLGNEALCAGVLVAAVECLERVGREHSRWNCSTDRSRGGSSIDGPMG
jgi:hypothetical protein